jgi:NAD(P)-dependent dehydrogenase (short-subunit alcohol dehydrogenase family)
MLDVLIHNAGVIHPEFATDGAGTGLTVLGQVVAPFLLTRLLMPALLAAAPSRVITVSSGGMYTPGVAAALPRFRRVTRPILLSPEQGANTIVWRPGPNTRCRGRAGKTPLPRSGSGTAWQS